MIFGKEQKSFTVHLTVCSLKVQLNIVPPLQSITIRFYQLLSVNLHSTDINCYRASCCKSVLSLVSIHRPVMFLEGFGELMGAIVF